MRWEWMLLLMGVVAIPLGCLLPNSRLPHPLPNDKLLHFVAFGGMALLAGRLAHGATQMGLALAAVFVASWIIELLQMWVPGRGFCWRDLAANAAGVLCAGACLALLPPA
ncbi:MAG: VanZ family protein [Pseudomonadota bacterium]|nr:VanZ family protein [Pseudomonadota bacterium]